MNEILDEKERETEGTRKGEEGEREKEEERIGMKSEKGNVRKKEKKEIDYCNGSYWLGCLLNVIPI